MRPHPVFAGLLIADDADIAAALGAGVVGRTTVHEWPLARTEDVALDDGRRLALKAQLPPTVEPAFYAGARGSVLPRGRSVSALDALDTTAACRWIAVDWIDAPALDTVADDAEFVRLARQAADGIAAVDPGDRSASIHLDLSLTGFDAVVADTADGLAGHLASGAFAGPPADAAARLLAWSREPATRRALERTPVVAHGDLFPDEVLLAPDGIRVLDWQRPIWGPPGIDLAGLLTRRGIPLAGIADPVAARFQALAELRWAVVALRDILPGLPPSLPDGWATTALRTLLAQPD